MRSERRSGIPKMIWREVVSKDLQILNVNADMVSNKAQWQLKIHIADPNYSGILVLVDLFSLPNVKSWFVCPSVSASCYHVYIHASWETREKKGIDSLSLASHVISVAIHMFCINFQQTLTDASSMQQTTCTP